VARMTQLAMEYDPQPPFDCGSPAKAGPEVTRQVQEWMGPFTPVILKVCAEAALAMPK